MAAKVRKIWEWAGGIFAFGVWLFNSASLSLPVWWRRSFLFVQVCRKHISMIGFQPIFNGRFKYINVYIFQRFKLDAITGHARLPKFFTVGFG